MNEKTSLDDFTQWDDSLHHEIFQTDEIRSSLDETSAGEAPEDWVLVRLGELVEDTLYGANESAEEYDPDKPRYVRIKDINELGRLKDKDKASLSREKAESYILSEGDMLIARSGSPGRTYLYRIDDGECCYGGYSIRHELVTKGLNHEYLLQFTKSQRYRDWIERISRQGAQANINSGELASLLIPLPPLGEQRKIASVCYACDEAIQKTQAVTKQVYSTKAAVLQDLLRYGPNNDSSQNVHLGPKSVQIPEHWSVTTMDNISIKMRNGFVGTATPYYTDSDQGIPYLQSFNIRPNRIEGRDQMEYVEQSFHEDNPETELNEGDMLTVQSGHIGTSCIVPEEFAGANAHALIITRFDTGLVHPHFVSQFLNSKIGRDLIASITVGTTVDHINVKEFKNMRLPLPPKSEQKEIVSTLSALEDLIEMEEEVAEAYRMLKKSLMQDFFSGSVRTHNKDIEVIDEVLAHG